MHSCSEMNNLMKMTKQIVFVKLATYVLLGGLLAIGIWFGTDIRGQVSTRQSGTCQNIPESCLEPIKDLRADNLELTQIARWNDKSVKSAPVVGYLHPEDTVPTIIVPTSSKLYALQLDPDSQELKIRWQTESKTASNTLSAAIADIDNDGMMEIFSSYGRSLYMFNYNGELVQSVDTSARLFNPAVADIDGDGVGEILTVDKIINADGSIKQDAPPYIWGKDPPIAYDIHATAGLELITDKGVYDSHSEEICTFVDAVQKRAIGKMHATDTHYTIVGISRTKGVVGYSIGDGTECELLFETPLQTKPGGAINIADYDNDGDLDFATASKRKLYAYSYDESTNNWEIAWAKDIYESSSGYTGLTAFDFNGDGKTELVYADQQFLYIIDGVDGSTLYQAENISATWSEYPIIADVTGDSVANIVVVSSTAHTRGVTIYGAPNNDWVSVRALWNQYDYYATNINDNGTVSGVNSTAIWSPWLDSEHLVGFRNNIPQRRVNSDSTDPACQNILHCPPRCIDDDCNILIPPCQGEQCDTTLPPDPDLQEEVNCEESVQDQCDVHQERIQGYRVLLDEQEEVIRNMLNDRDEQDEKLGQIMDLIREFVERREGISHQLITDSYDGLREILDSYTCNEEVD